jgi:hypothetical protein
MSGGETRLYGYFVHAIPCREFPMFRSESG